MARPRILSFLTLNSYFKKYYTHVNTQSSFYKTSVRYLRGSRYSKDQTHEELKYQRLFKSFKYGSKPLQPERTSGENVSTEIQKKDTESDNKLEIARLTPEDLISRLELKMYPLKFLPYTRQLEKKYKRCLGILKVFGRKLQILNVPIAMGEDKLPCPVDLVVPSPVIEAYRNKDEFNIGLGLDGNEKTVGFFLDVPTEFSTTFCISSKDLSSVRESHKKIVEDFQNYISLSPLPASQHYTDKGYWRSLMARSNCAGDVMGIVVMNPQELSREELQVEKDKLKDYFSCIPKSSYNLQSLYFQTCSQSRCTHEQSPFELLMGDPFIIEEANNMILHLSPDSFFHVNTKAAEVLFNSLLKICRVNKSTTVLDVCCGVGPLSLLFSPKVKKCIGIDDSMQAIIDAKLNAMENRAQNVEFLYGRPEVVLKDVLTNDFHEELLVVVNSSRGEVSKAFIASLREHKNVDKIVYISTKPHAVVDNYIQLCRPCGPLAKLGKAFLPILALPFDIAPHTEQLGIIMMFQRL